MEDRNPGDGLSRQQDLISVLGSRDARLIIIFWQVVGKFFSGLSIESINSNSFQFNA